MPGRAAERHADLIIASVEAAAPGPVVLAAQDVGYRHLGRAPGAGQRVHGRSAIIGRMARHDHSFFEGGIYEDCAYHPVLCTKVDEEERDLEGISLIDGSMPRACSIDHCGPGLLSIRGALLICMNFEVYRQRRIDGLEIEEALIDLPRTTLP